MCKLCALVETVMNLYAEFAHRMSASDDPRRVHFQSPEYLVDRLDAIADRSETTADALDRLEGTVDTLETDLEAVTTDVAELRTDVLVEAIREYIKDTADSETFQELVAAKYYDDQLDFETVKQLVGAETAQRLRLLKSDLEDEPLDIDAPDDDVDIYGGDATTVATDADE